MTRIAPILVLVVFTLACGEPEEDAEACEPSQDYPYAAGDIWGPCLEDSTCDLGWCWPYSDAGNMCVLGNCAAEAYPSPWCGETYNFLPDTVWGACLPICDSGTDCVGGMVCDDDEEVVYPSVCVWPKSDEP